MTLSMYDTFVSTSNIKMMEITGLKKQGLKLQSHYQDTSYFETVKTLVLIYRWMGG